MSIVKVAFYADNNGNLSRSTFEMDDAGFDGELSIYGEFEAAEIIAGKGAKLGELVDLAGWPEAKATKVYGSTGQYFGLVAVAA